MATHGSRPTRKRIQPEDYHYRVFNCPNWNLEQRLKAIDLFDSELQAQNQISVENRREREFCIEILNLKLKIVNQSFVLFEKYFNTFQRSWEASANSHKTLSKEIIKRRKEIKLLNSQKILLGDVRSAMERRVANIQVVKNFMTSVCTEAKEEYSSADDVIKRFEFLFKTREAQIERITASDKKMESLKQLLQDSAIEDDSELLSLQLKVLDMESQRSNLEAKLQALHERLLDTKASLLENMIKVPVLTTAITDLYIRICKKLNENPNLALPITDQMEYVQVAFKQILGMRKNAHRMVGPVSNFATGKRSVKSSSSNKA